VRLAWTGASAARCGSDEEDDAPESRDRVDDERDTASAVRRRPYSDEDVYVR
jgi:hypothetical protein